MSQERPRDKVLVAEDEPDLARILQFGYDEGYRRIPIIILSARTQEGDQALALEMGANLFITKPYDFAGILGHVEALVQLPTMRPSAR